MTCFFKTSLWNYTGVLIECTTFDNIIYRLFYVDSQDSRVITGIWGGHVKGEVGTCKPKKVGKNDVNKLHCFQVQKTKCNQKPAQNASEWLRYGRLQECVNEKGSTLLGRLISVSWREKHFDQQHKREPQRGHMEGCQYIHATCFVTWVFMWTECSSNQSCDTRGSASDHMLET